MKRMLTAMICGLMLLTMTACDKGGSTPSGTDNTGTTTPSPDTTPVNTTDATTTPADTTTEADTTTAASGDNSTVRDPSKKLRILLIGNSFTYYNDMNQPKGIFYNIVKNAGYDVIVDSVYKGGYYLRQFLDENDTYGKQVLSRLKSNIKYDIVVIQEQSAQPIADPGEFYDSCRAFKQLIDANGAEMWLYETWGYKTGNSGLAKYGKSTFDMEMKLRAAYTAIGEELGVPVVYAGAAFSKVFKENPAVELYHTDLKHPGEMGSYLIAWTLFGTIFGVDPATLTYNGSVSQSNADILRAAASDISLNGAPVDPSYKTSSAGVVSKNPTYVDADKTRMLTSAPGSQIISVVKRDSDVTGDGWVKVYGATGTFSGIRGDKDKIASTESSATQLTDAQKADIADIGYGVSVIGISHMDATKKGAVNTKNDGGVTNSVINLVNGHWGSSFMAAMYFNKDTYNINGEKDANSHYTGLITLNFGSKMKFDAIGYMSGSLKGFAQAQDVYVSDDGINWTKVESACYDAKLTSLKSVNTAGNPDPWNNNKATVEVLFSMSGYSGKYIRIGIYRGGEVTDNTTGLEEINTREIVVFGEKE
ncbi:MAG: discoidin domain-containing protein [Eubacteriales bacterium]|nr:discoidin domain-containing protein [Eubacteriales bacterium]MDY4898061.1 discoidin domain-containing protein [Eubacteriales bacterium]